MIERDGGHRHSLALLPGAVSSILSITTATSTASEPEPSTPKFGSKAGTWSLVSSGIVGLVLGKAKPQPAITEVLEAGIRDVWSHDGSLHSTILCPTGNVTSHICV